MFGKYQGVFRSRWKALWWAFGICTTAYCSVPSPDEPAGKTADSALAVAVPGLPSDTASQLSPDQEGALRSIDGPGNTAPDAEPTRHVNPWALPEKG